jgi:hypothetical protein
MADKRIVLNINDYREERKRQLEEKAVEIANYVLESNRSYRFPFLSSYERFIVHAKISENSDYADLESFSIGEGRQRRLVVQIKEGSEAMSKAESAKTEVAADDQVETTVEEDAPTDTDQEA